MENEIYTSQEILDFYGNRIVKAFYNLVLCKNYENENKDAIDNYSVIIHPSNVCGLFKKYDEANSMFMFLKSGAEINKNCRG